jgi:CTP:molybdopterin cytidylyltransferase MocA
VTAAGSHVAGVVIAGGTGRRMGGPKALIELDGQALAARAVDVLADGGCSPVAVVVGASADAVRATVPPIAAVVDNPDWASGMASSVRAALGWAGAVPDCAAVVVLPVDTPGIGAPVVRRLVDAFDADPDARRAVVATYDGRSRNPVLLPAGLWDEVGARVRGDTGARAWLRDNPDRVVGIDCADVGDPTDLDTPDDLARWRG